MATENTKIQCAICGAEVHSIQLHLRDLHPDVTLDDYQRRFPASPLMSRLAAERLAARKSAGVKAEAVTAAAVWPGATGKEAMHDLFGLGRVKAAMNARGEPIPVTVLERGSHTDMIPGANDNYVYDIENLKNVLMAFELNIPTYVWGHAGTGKTELFEQVCARTNRAWIRVQHTVNTEEAHIIGMRVARSGETPFELGPLALAMKHGWVYLADEYDFAMPSVLSVYQPVLEGKSLVIKEADGDNRVIKPHPNFRFCATGNTNGSGDDTGLYQGTNIQNAANYDRFGMVIQQRYMKSDMEAQILVNQAGIAKEEAARIVDFANRVRESYEGNKISATISPRTLINAARLGMRRANWRTGIALSFTNKLSRVDREAVDSLAQRVFG